MSKLNVLLVLVATVSACKDEPSSSNASPPLVTVTVPVPVPIPAPPPPAPSAKPASGAEKAAALNDQGRDLMYASKFEEAEPLFRKAFELVPEPKYLFNDATALLQLGRFDDATDALDKLLAPGRSITDDMRAKSQSLTSKIVAECEAQKVVCKRPAGQPAAKLPASNTPTKADPERAAVLNEEAKALMLAGKYGEAEALYRRVVKLSPEPKYFFNLAVDLFQQGKFDDALGALTNVRANKPSPELFDKAEKLAAKIVAECKSQGFPCAGGS